MNNSECYFDEDALPHELTMVVYSYMDLKSVLKMMQTNRYANRSIVENIDDIIYSLDDTACRDKYEIMKSTMYKEYYRGKCYSWKYQEDPIDTKFILRDSDRIIGFADHIVDSNEKAIVMVSLSRNLLYTLRYFAPEVFPGEEYTPEYHGWELCDLGIHVLAHTIEYSFYKALITDITSPSRFENVMNGSTKWIDQEDIRPHLINSILNTQK